jgi:hypothetical protein
VAVEVAEAGLTGLKRKIDVIRSRSIGTVLEALILDHCRFYGLM